MVVASADGNRRPPRPQVDRREVISHLCTGERETGVSTPGVAAQEACTGFFGTGPLVSSPCSETPLSPSCPPSLAPQHLTVASSCGEYCVSDARESEAGASMAAAEAQARQRVPAAGSHTQASLGLQNLTSSAHVCVPPALTEIAVLPAPRSTAREVLGSKRSRLSPSPSCP